RACFQARLYGYLPYFVNTPRYQVHIAAQFTSNAPVLIAPHIGKLANALLFLAARLMRGNRCLCLLPVFARSINHAPDTLLSLVRSLYDRALDLIQAFIYITNIILIRLIGAICGLGILPPLVAHEFIPPS